MSDLYYEKGQKGEGRGEGEEKPVLFISFSGFTQPFGQLRA